MVVAQAWREDQAAMKPLGPASAVGSTHQIRLPRNHYITVDTNHYSVAPSMIGRIVTVTVDLRLVRILGPDGRIVGTHERLWAKIKS